MGKIAKIALVNVLVAIFLLFVVEGAASYLTTALEISASRPIPERSHTEYDEMLGWVNVPNLQIPDMYGPGVYLETNAQRFRNARDFDPVVPDGTVRIICSGDSFTLGLGVDNDHTWCALLDSTSSTIESVNMGQGGYGIDQAYLWYRRDGTALDHDIHIFAFITEDFWRMQRDSFLGYGKPVLYLEGSTLKAQNTPVPRTTYRMPWLTRALPILAELNTVRVASAAIQRAGALLGAGGTGEGAGEEALEGVVAKIFDDLLEINESKGSRLVLVYLPAEEDYLGVGDTEQWRRFVEQEAARRRIPYVDVVEHLRALSPQQMKEMFGEHQHYSEEGNAFVAGILRRRLAEMPDTGAMLSEGRQD